MNSMIIYVSNKKNNVSNEKYKNKKNKSSHVNIALSEKSQQEKLLFKNKNKQALNSKIKKKKTYFIIHTRISDKYIKQSQHA